MSKKLKTGLLAYLLLPMAVMGREEKPLTDTVVQQHHSPKPKPKTKKKSNEKVQFGVASYYANKFEGRPTYTDEIFTQKKMTAASNTLPMHTWVKVTNLRNNRSCYVRINDKMHPKNRRLIDMSRAAAKRLGYAGHGLTRVRIDVLGRKKPAEAIEQEKRDLAANKAEK